MSVHVEYLAAKHVFVAYQPESDLADILDFEPGPDNVLALSGPDSVVVIEGSAAHLRRLAERILAVVPATP